MKTSIGEPVRIDDKETGLLAYQLWEQAGRPSGKDQYFWFEAEKQLHARAQSVVTIPVQIPATRPSEAKASRPEQTPSVPTTPVKLSPARNKSPEKAPEPAKRPVLSRLGISKPGKN